MRLCCPYCGSRDVAEFSYLGDATISRPQPGSADATSHFVEAVYLRENPAGPHEELWYHSGGCRSWLRVRRDTVTHEVLAVSFARSTAAQSTVT